ncbi:ATP-binding protein [Streptomyces sp. NPDC091280]|uniref:ATP-binding protein n=1 Tax=Streptomyces sp. NPDC091280 TaxID=3365984 RepID=UPI0037F6F4DD
MWTLPGRSERSPHEARKRITRTCREWHVPPEITDDLALIISELVTNAVTHAHGDTVTVALVLIGHEVWVAVVDRGPRTPFEARHAGDDDEHGRGLFLVKALASRYEICPAGAGTAVTVCLNTSWRAVTGPCSHSEVTHSHHELTEDADAPRSH